MALSPTKANFAPLLFAGDMNRGMEIAAQLGYDGVELNLLDSTRLDQDEILKKVRECGLKVPSIGTGQSYFHDNLSLADTSPQIQNAVRDRLFGHIEFAGKLGAAVVLGSIRGKLNTNSPKARQADYSIAIDAVQELADFAAKLEINLTIEPINRYETNFLNTIGETLEFIQRVGRQNVGVLADTFHMNIEEKNITDSLREAGSLLSHVHLADSNRYAPGMGHLDFQSITATLKDIGYDGFLSAEIIPVPDSSLAAKTWINTIRPMIRS
jgi:sugar phosphate isomerase/epimerase